MSTWQPIRHGEEAEWTASKGPAKDDGGLRTAGYEGGMSRRAADMIGLPLCSYTSWSELRSGWEGTQHGTCERISPGGVSATAALVRIRRRECQRAFHVGMTSCTTSTVATQVRVLAARNKPFRSPLSRPDEGNLSRLAGLRGNPETQSERVPIAGP